MRRLLLFVLCLLVARTATAQLVITPTTAIAFTASLDHNGTFGSPPIPTVSNYQLDFCVSTVALTAICATPAIAGVNVGKPTPDGTNTITVPALASLVQPNTTYVAFVSAVGPGGVGVDPTSSVPFIRPGPPRAPVGAPAPK